MKQSNNEAIELLLQTVKDQLFYLSPDVMIITDLTGTVVQVNNSFQEWLGFTPEEIIGQKAYELPLLPDESKKLVAVKARQRASGQKVDPYELEIVNKAGERQICRMTGNLVFDISGKPLGALVMAANITDQKIAEEELQREKERCQMYLDIAGVIIVIINRDHTVQLINKYGTKLLGYDSSTDIIGKNWFQNFIPDNLRSHLTNLFDQFIAGAPDLDFSNYENPAVTKTGEQKIITWHNAALKDEQGRIYATISSGTDITDRQKAEQELKSRADEQERMNQLMIGREIKMSELKKDIQELKKKLGE